MFAFSGPVEGVLTRKFSVAMFLFCFLFFVKWRPSHQESKKCTAKCECSLKKYNFSSDAPARYCDIYVAAQCRDSIGNPQAAILNVLVTHNKPFWYTMSSQLARIPHEVARISTVAWRQASVSGSRCTMRKLTLNQNKVSRFSDLHTCSYPSLKNGVSTSLNTVEYTNSCHPVDDV